MNSQRFRVDPEKTLNLVLYVAQEVHQATFHTIPKVIYFADKLHLERYRGGFGNSDSVISGSLASAKPPSGGEHKEPGDEENTTESRSDL